MDYERIVLSLEQSVYNRNLINNAERGAYTNRRACPRPRLPAVRR